MTYRENSNREGNQQRIIEMHKARMKPGVIRAYMHSWGLPISEHTVLGTIADYEIMGSRAAPKAEVAKAITLNDHIEAMFGESETFAHELVKEEDAE
ncbi:hypothetical protein [Paracidovorax citrulli]|uniref:hypothetical protein n=1 Tax=Paracidovorax citrulli TaxID=80869 RepID=UPI003FA7EE50